MMKSFRNSVLILIAIVSIVCTVSLAYAAPKKSEGKSIFREKCSMCHGIGGEGYPAIKTPNFTDPKWQSAHSEKERLNALENGVKGTAMVSFKGKLTQEQMKEVLKYIRSLGAKKKK